MADFIEKNEWAAKLRMIEPGDSVIGGVNAPINLPFAGLANRTLWLKNEIAAAVQTIGGLGNNKADKTTQIIAGNGLTGGGDLSASRTLALGTPGSITAASTNSVSTTSHTHAIDSATTERAGVVQLNDTLTSTATNLALTAAQGKALRELLDGLSNDAFKVRGDLGNLNLNNVIGANYYGILYRRVNASATPELNYPVQQAGVLLVLPAAYQGVQLYVPYMSNVLYVRNMLQSGGFTDWRIIGEVIDNLDSSSITAALSAAQGKAIKERLDAAGVGGKAPVANSSTGVNDLLTDLPDTCQDYTLSGNYKNGPLGVETKNYTGIINVSTCTFDAGVSKVLTMRQADGSVWQNVRNNSTWRGWERIDALGAASADALAQGLARKADKATTLSGYGIADGVTKSALNATINSLINGAPGALDTLSELATALGNDANFANTVAAKIDQAAPAGTVAYVAGSAAPAGWLKANGAAVSRTTYAALFAAIGTRYGAGNGSSTFNLPDLRGEFLRGWDDGRGADTGRALGSLQTDAIRNITGSFNLRQNGLLADATGALSQERTGYVTQWFAVTNSGASDVVTFDASRIVPTASENRPRNIALMACIKI